MGKLTRYPGFFETRCGIILLLTGQYLPSGNPVWIEDAAEHYVSEHYVSMTPSTIEFNYRVVLQVRR